MTKTSKIVQIQNAGQIGQWHKFEYHLEDGFSGNSYSKNEKPYGAVGDVIEYEAGTDKNGQPKINIKKKVAGPSVNTDAQRVDIQNKNVEVNKERLNFDKDKQVLIIRQSSIKAAVDYIVNRGNPDADYTSVLELSDIFTNYVLTGKHPDITEMDKLPF